MEERLQYLFQRYLTNACTEKELDEFLALVNRSNNDEMVRELIKDVYHNLQQNPSAITHVNELGKLILTEPEWTLAPQVPVQPKKINRHAIVSIAAALIIFTSIFWLFKNKINEQKSATISSVTKKSSNRSEFKYLLLEDSTQVWLNAASSLEFPDHFSSTKREVILTGEAFFDVKHADKIPFIIKTGNVSTSVLGTAFNIKAYPGQESIIVSVSRGKVKVERNDGWETTLNEGQLVKLGPEKAKASEKNIPPAEVAAWQKGNIVFDDEVLVDIINDLERVYNVEIRLTDNSIKDLRISTGFKREIGIDQALQVLCKLTDLELNKANGIYFIH
jgi:ferric-dicitrate binding protein FerR (iron transport regulator)